MLTLLACSDDYLLEESLREEVARARAALGDVEPEYFPEEVTPEKVALEVSSPSLFSPQRVLVLADARGWVDAPAASGAAAATRTDVGPLLVALENGLPDDTALIIGVWCGGKPKGNLVEVVTQYGTVSWIPLPPPPKPWEDVALSDEQRDVLRGVVRRAAPGLRLSPAAASLLLERLGFAPRLLAQEVRKLATAAGEGEVIQEELVRQLTFPRERSLEVVRDAVLERDGTTLLDLLGAAAAGIPLRDWRGQRLEGGSLATVLLAQVGNLLLQLLYLRRLAATTGLIQEMSPRKTASRGWYGRVFKGRLGARLSAAITADEASPLLRSGKAPSEWTLGQLFAGAGRYQDGELTAALAEAGQVELGLRGALGLEAVSRWLAALMRR